jgi:hypothetical protein
MNCSIFNQRHAFHLVDPSIMPLLTSFACLVLTVGGVLFFHGYVGGIETVSFGLFFCTFLYVYLMT